jgi:DNA-binding protein H-NS
MEHVMAKTETALNGDWRSTFVAADLSSQRDALDDLTAIHESAKERRRQELRAELQSLSGKNPSPSPAKAPAKFRGPNGETYSGRGALPSWATALGVTDKAGMERFRV